MNFRSCLNDFIAEPPQAGYGIGLSMANDIVRAHHGSIRVVNMQTGAAFTITLPVLDGIKPYLDAEGD